MTASVMTNPTSLEKVEGHSDEMLINLGPQHPATHGVLKVVLGVDGERVTRAIPHIGFLHRNHEKLEEVRTYPDVHPVHGSHGLRLGDAERTAAVPGCRGHAEH